MKFPTYEEMAQKVAEKALDEFLYNGKSIREWMQIIASEDAISRQTVKEQMIKYGFHAPDMTVTEFVEDLPSVNPQQKMGHWIEHEIEDTLRWVTCSECNCETFKKFNYCPNCGRRMVEPQEGANE